ncbi:MAG: hypothetical protein ABIB46_03975 [bacterium]
MKQRILFLIVIVFLLSKLGITENTYIQHFEQGQQYFDDFEFDKAISEFNAVITDSQSSQEYKIKAYYSLAMIYKGYSEFIQAKNQFKEILKLDANYKLPEDVPFKLKELLEEVKTEKALEEKKEVLEVKKEEPKKEVEKTEELKTKEIKIEDKKESKIMKKVFLSSAIISGCAAIFAHLQYEKNFEKYNSINDTSNADYSNLESYYKNANTYYKLRDILIGVSGISFTLTFVGGF